MILLVLTQILRLFQPPASGRLSKMISPIEPATPPPAVSRANAAALHSWPSDMGGTHVGSQRMSPSLRSNPARSPQPTPMQIAAGWQSGVLCADGLQSPRVKPMKRAYRRRLQLGGASPEKQTAAHKTRCSSRQRHMPVRMELDMASNEELADLDEGTAPGWTGAEMDFIMQATGMFQ